MIEIKNNALTHGGNFHADDVFSAALLKIINPNIKITRALNVPEEFDGIVFDIGFGKFDHHQDNSEVRQNGVPYAAFGLLWGEFGESIISAGCSPEQAAKEAARFDEMFIQPLDIDDNTGGGNQLASVIGSFNPSWDSDEELDICYSKAVEFAIVILKNKIEGIMSIQRAKALVEKALAEAVNNIVVLPRFAPWKMVLVQSDAQFVVYPSHRGGYSAQVIPADSDSKRTKCDFPDEWAGKNEDELQQISGIKTITFCHKGRFLISANELDDAIKACELAMDIESK